MSENYDYVYDVWAELVQDACQTEDPRSKIISLLLEFESGVYNRALNDVLLNLEKSKSNRADVKMIKRLLLGTNVCSEDIKINDGEIIHFPVTS